MDTVNIQCQSYCEQRESWPQAGRHVLAHFDDESVLVYQAYRPEIGHFAAQHGYFGGAFSLSRMSWIKPGFLWMMYRSGWATKPGQEVILAVRMKRSAFDQILSQAVHSSYVPALYPSKEAWQKQLKNSAVALQWDPDHNPKGGKMERRAIQLGLRGPVLASYAREWILSIEDITEFVAGQRLLFDAKDKLRTPTERVYPVADAVKQRLGIESGTDSGTR
jgi:hypothetical protein